MSRSAGEDGRASAVDPAHDPHEVTVQLDAVQLGDVRLLPAEGARTARGQDGSDRPVFVDESGRRSRRFRRLGMLVGVACAVYAVVIVVTLLSGSSDAPWLPVPGENDRPAGQVDTSPRPTESVRPSDTGSTTPGATPTANDGITPEPGTGAAQPGVTTSPGGPGTSADPGPTASGPTSGAGTGGSGGGPTAGPKPSTEPPASSSPDPSDPVDPGGPSPDPSESTAGGGADTGALAGDSSTPAPIAKESGSTASSATDPSPEHNL
ncbi:hypothetical protein [Streptomyces shenzhenensis]|uniref:hypothetical protein n=1 Tax=Streptomyces shenzhenensis TaxID=943815 RepID=UPI0011C491BE|nr:hypothetical protein [Streptomyces shenzhenensis]